MITKSKRKVREIPGILKPRKKTKHELEKYSKMKESETRNHVKLNKTPFTLHIHNLLVGKEKPSFAVHSFWDKYIKKAPLSIFVMNESISFGEIIYLFIRHGYKFSFKAMYLLLLRTDIKLVHINFILDNIGSTLFDTTLQKKQRDFIQRSLLFSQSNFLTFEELINVIPRWNSISFFRQNNFYIDENNLISHSLITLEFMQNILHNICEIHVNATVLDEIIKIRYKKQDEQSDDIILTHLFENENCPLDIIEYCLDTIFTENTLKGDESNFNRNLKEVTLYFGDANIIYESPDNLRTFKNSKEFITFVHNIQLHIINRVVDHNQNLTVDFIKKYKGLLESSTDIYKRLSFNSSFNCKDVEQIIKQNILFDMKGFVACNLNCTADYFLSNTKYHSKRLLEEYLQSSYRTNRQILKKMYIAFKEHPEIISNMAYNSNISLQFLKKRNFYTHDGDLYYETIKIKRNLLFLTLNFKNLNELREISNELNIDYHSLSFNQNLHHEFVQEVQEKVDEEKKGENKENQERDRWSWIRLATNPFMGSKEAEFEQHKKNIPRILKDIPLNIIHLSLEYLNPKNNMSMYFYT